MKLPPSTSSLAVVVRAFYTVVSAMRKYCTEPWVAFGFIAFGALAVLALAGWLRFAGLGERPLHFDEGTNARILASRLADGDYVFNPEHFHGPLLSLVQQPVVQWRGEASWQALTKTGMRMATAVCGLLAVGVALGLGRMGRLADGLAAAACVATSPLLVYYSRMGIHESLFVLCGLVALIAFKAFLHRPTLMHALELGLGVGLMAATRETFVISLAAWGAAAVVWWFQVHPHTSPMAVLRQRWLQYARLLLVSALVVAVIVVMCYSDFGRHPEGIIDFFRVYACYDTVSGHEKPAYYFLELLLWPKQRAGMWWTEVAILAAALYGYFRCPQGGVRTALCRFMVHSGVLHLAVYSSIAYKTPWLACLGWVHVCLAAGIGIVQSLDDARGWRRVPVVAVVVAIFLWQGTQSRQATGRLASDARNPYAYVPTSMDVERMAVWLNTLREKHPMLNTEAIAVVGRFYWPLPWYLRDFNNVGYWDALPADAAVRPLLLILPTAENRDALELESTHALFPRGLRHEVPVTVAIRRDIWEAETSP